MTDRADGGEHLDRDGEQHLEVELDLSRNADRAPCAVRRERESREREREEGVAGDPAAGCQRTGAVCTPGSVRVTGVGAGARHGL